MIINLTNLLSRCLVFAKSWLCARVVARQSTLGSRCRLHGLPIVTRFPGSRLTVGNRVTLTSRSSRTALGVNHRVVLRTLTPTAVLNIADDVGISGGTICAALMVHIGPGTLLGANVTVADTDFHPVEHLNRRYAALPEPTSGDEVIIGRNVFIGTGAIVLRGTNIGDNSVIGAGSVLKGDFGPNSVIAGNPARLLRTFEPTRR